VESDHRDESGRAALLQRVEVGEGGALTAARAAAPCNALDPAQLVRQAQQEEAIDNSTPGADGAPAEPLLDIVSADVSQGSRW